MDNSFFENFGNSIMSSGGDGSNMGFSSSASMNGDTPDSSSNNMAVLSAAASSSILKGSSNSMCYHHSTPPYARINPSTTRPLAGPYNTTISQSFPSHLNTPLNNASLATSNIFPSTVAAAATAASYQSPSSSSVFFPQQQQQLGTANNSSRVQLPTSPQETSEGEMLLPGVSRRQSTSSHGSPIPPSSPSAMEDETDYSKSYQYRSPITSIGMNPPTFSSYPSPHHHHPQTASLPMHYGMNYTNNPSISCYTSMYAGQESMYSSGTSSLTLPMWNYSSLPSMSFAANSMTKLSLDTPRYKLTPERAIPLTKWFDEHKEHPYPTRHEKMLLCQSTQLTYTQVSTWFANARRRMKKASSEEEECRSSHSSSDECSSQNSLDSPMQ